MFRERFANRITMNQLEKEKPVVINSADYLRGYRDGVRDAHLKARRFSGDGILGALLAIALLSGAGYLTWNYITTGQILPVNVEIKAPEVKVGG